MEGVRGECWRAQTRELKETCCTLGFGTLKHGTSFHVLFCDSVDGSSSSHHLNLYRPFIFHIKTIL